MIQITSNNALFLNGQPTGLHLVQRNDKTVIYTPENKLTGQMYREHKMPSVRYSMGHNLPSSGVLGIEQLEHDLCILLDRLSLEAAQSAYDAAKAAEREARARYDALENSDHPDHAELAAAADALGDAVQAYEKATAQERGNATYRAAYWLSADKQADVRLTDRTQADLPDGQLLAAAMATAAEVGLEIGDGSIEIGDFTE